MLRVLLRRAKTDPYGNKVFMGRTLSLVCPVAAVLGYLAVRPAGQSPLFVFRDGTPHSRDLFVRDVRSALSVAHINHQAYSGHSFRIDAATMAAQGGLPAYTCTINMLGRWTLDAYQMYAQMPRESLAAVAQSISQ